MSEPLTDEELVALVRAQRTDVTAPAELWPLVAASTIHVRAVRRQVLRSMRGLLLLVAVVLVGATAFLTWQFAVWKLSVPQAPPISERARTGGGGTHAGHAGHPERPPTPPAPPRAPAAPQ